MNIDFRQIQSTVKQESRTAFHAAREHHRVVYARGGPLLCTRNLEGQCGPNIAAECPYWNGTKASIVALVSDVLVHHPHVTEIYIEGAYDGAESSNAFQNGDYDPRVEEWSVSVWRRGVGYVNGVE